MGDSLATVETTTSFVVPIRENTKDTWQAQGGAVLKRHVSLTWVEKNLDRYVEVDSPCP